MRLLIVTQKVDKDDSYFAFFHEWLIRFAREVETLTVISLEERAHNLPTNVTVLSLGKEVGKSRFHYIKTLLTLIYKKRNEYDAVFCHMSPWYVIVGAPIWKWFKKPIAMWYIHRQVDLKLRIATILADTIFSSSKESFRIKSNKVNFVGQATDTDFFAKRTMMGVRDSHAIKIISVGRITPIKNLETLFAAVAILRKDFPVTLECIGPAISALDRDYEKKLWSLAQSLSITDIVRFRGPVLYSESREEYWQAALSVNLAPSGGMDKVVLESLSAGCPVFVANEAFRPVLGPYADQFMFTYADEKNLAHKISVFLLKNNHEDAMRFLTSRMREEYDLSHLIHNVVKTIEGFV